MKRKQELRKRRRARREAAEARRAEVRQRDAVAHERQMASVFAAGVRLFGEKRPLPRTKNRFFTRRN